MNAESYWKQFVTTGKIEDYLNYSRISRQEKDPKESSKTDREGVCPHAGGSYGNGNYFKPDAYR